ncbi:MAG: hypothetical protein DWC06_06765 [Candidatus Poseidoniales archaeon]|nr:MAG: hypothetical protein DWC06_06765 [Candidatus Poseidoniales archaeon]
MKTKIPPSLFIPPIEIQFMDKTACKYPCTGLSLYGGLGLPVGITHGMDRAQTTKIKIRGVIF